MVKKRTEAERRARQCQRVARLIKVLRLVLGHGRWGPEDLAREIECSTRTIQRDIEVLSQSGVPLYYDRNSEAYRVREGFKFPGIEPQTPLADLNREFAEKLLRQTKQFLRERAGLLRELEELSRVLESKK